MNQDPEHRGATERQREDKPTKDISSATLKAYARQVVGLDLIDAEAEQLAPVLDGIIKIMRSIPVAEDVAPAVVFRLRKGG